MKPIKPMNPFNLKVTVDISAHPGSVPTKAIEGMLVIYIERLFRDKEVTQGTDIEILKHSIKVEVVK